MSEIKGQLLGILLVLMLFGTMTVALTAIFSNMTGKIENEVSEIEKKLESKAAPRIMHY